MEYYSESVWEKKVGRKKAKQKGNFDILKDTARGGWKKKVNDKHLYNGFEDNQSLLFTML